jgi:hypothetical protein
VVNYEDSVRDFESVARRLIGATGLEWEPAVLDLHKNPRVVRTASVDQVREKLYDRSVGRWKNYRGEPDLRDLFHDLTSDE